MGNDGWKAENWGRLIMLDAQWGIIMQLVKLLWRLVFLQIWDLKQKAGWQRKGEPYVPTESFSRTGYGIVSH